MKNDSTIKVALADDHILLRNALANLIDNFEGCKVVCQANDGKELIKSVQTEAKPDVILLDLSMPTMDGYDTAQWFQKNMPDIHILMLTMYDADQLLIRLLQAGVKGFLKKDIHPSELKFAIISVMQAGYYYSAQTTHKFANLLLRKKPGDMFSYESSQLSDLEISFLKLACTEKTYKEIALELKLNPRTVDSLRDLLFEKLDVKSRVGLAIFAIKKGIVSLSS